MDLSDKQDSTNDDSQVMWNPTGDSGEIFYKTPEDKANRVVSTLEKDDSATNIESLNFGQDVSAIQLSEEMMQSPEKPLSEFQQLMQLMQGMNRQTMENTENINKKIAENTENINKNIGERIAENTENINKRIAENTENINERIAENTERIEKKIADNTDRLRAENLAQIEKLRETMEFKVSTFITQQERDVKVFMGNVIKEVDDKIDQTKSEMMGWMEEETKDREAQMECIKNSVERNQTQLLQEIEQHKAENSAWENKVEKINEERICIVAEKVNKNSKAIASVNKEVEQIIRENDKVREEVVDIKNKIDNNTAPTTVIASHMPNIRIHIPTFSGNNNSTMAPHFLNTLEEYFAITNVHKSNWLTYLGQAFQGSAIAWFRQVKSTCTNWDIFKEKFLENYHGAVQKMRYAAQVEESKQMLHEKAESFIWRISDIIKLAYPYMKEEEIVMCILRKMKCGFGTLIRDNIKTILELVQKANEMEEVIRIDGRSNNNARTDNQNEPRATNNQNGRQQGQYSQQSNSRPSNGGRWQQSDYRADDSNRFQDRTYRGNNGSSGYGRNNQSSTNHDGRDSQQMQVAAVNKGKGVGKRSSTSQDTNTARSQEDHLNGQGRVTAGQVAAPSTST